MFYSKLAWQNIKKNKQFYLPYILANIFIIAMFFVMINFISNDSLKHSGGGSDTIQVMGLGSVIVGIFSVIFLFYSNSFLIKHRKKEFGLYNILGMEKRHLAKVILIESVYTYVITTISGVAIGTLFFKVLHMVLMKLMKYDIPLGFEFHIQPIITTAILFGAISLMMFLNCIRQVYISNPVELLKGGQIGEKEPKSKWLLAIIGFIFLIIGYYLAITSTNALQALMMFFVAVICVIIGTYLLFTAGSIVILKSLRKNKKFYYRINNFTAVSGMIYRMKQNAIGLSNIAILSTMTIITMAGSVSLYLGIDDIINERYKDDIQIECSYNQSELDTQKIYTNIQDTLAEKNLTMSDYHQYNYLTITAYQTENGFIIKNPDSTENSMSLKDVAILTLITLEDYNSLTNQNVDLSSDQVLMYTKGYNASDTFKIEDTQYSVKLIDSLPINVGYSDVSEVAEIYVVLKDKSQLMDIYDINLKTYEVPSPLKYSISFNLDGSNEEKISFTDSLDDAIQTLSNDNCNLSIRCKQQQKESFYSMYGSILFLGILLGITFLIATSLIIYYKQLSEGYDDKQRFNIMQKVGLSKLEVKKTIHTQIIMVFFLPLVTAIIHTAFAFPMIKHILRAFALTNVKLFLICTLVCVLIFSLVYGLIYSITAKVYFKIATE